MSHFLSIQVEKKLQTAQGKFPLSVDLTVEKGEFLALTGSSGGGKTTLLRLLAGLEKADNGQIICEQKTWLDTRKKQFILPQKRSIGLVFQDYALFPNMTIQQNLSFALDKNLPANSIEELMELIDLTALAHRLPHQLSGGQQQRVALARALVRQPKILLLDEPLSALDTTMRHRLQDDLKRLHEAYHLTTILVTHDEREIFKLAHRVVVLETGKITRIGAPAEVLKDKGIFAVIQEMIPHEDQVKIIANQNETIITLILPKNRAENYSIGGVIFIA